MKPVLDASALLAVLLDLALAVDLRRPVLTADRAWAEFDVGIDIRLIR